VRIAIYGGSFDPVHIAHEAIVYEALKTIDLDLLILVPTFLNPHKKTSHLTPKDRLYLLNKNFLNIEKIKISDYEILQNRAVNSIETIKYFKKLYKTDKIYLIIGADNYSTFHTWYKSDEILEEVSLVVATRNGFLNKDYDNIQILNVDIDISSTHLRDKLNLDFVPKKIKDDVIKLWH